MCCLQLTELKAMLGVVERTRVVMGCITQTEDGRYSLEDLSASLPLDLSSAQVGDGFVTGAASSPPVAHTISTTFSASNQPQSTHINTWDDLSLTITLLNALVWDPSFRKL